MNEMQVPQGFEFGGYRLDRHRQLLIRIADGRPVSLPPRALQTLEYLLEHAGELVPRAALIDALWPQNTVEENSLDRNISLLRRALGETPKDHQFIATVPGRGYRFVARVSKVSGPEVDAPVAAHSPETSPAHQLYLQALARAYQPTEESIRAALELLARATRLDPRHTRAWSLLATVHALCVVWDYPVPDTLRSAGTAARRALELDPRDGAPHAAMGLIHAFRGEWLEAERYFSAADSMPNEAYFVGLRHHVSMAVGHIRRSKEQMLRVYRTGLAEPFAAGTLAALELTAGDHVEAQRYLDEAMALGAPRNVAPYPDLAGQILLRRRRYEEAAARLTGCMQHEGRDEETLRVVARIYETLREPALAPETVAALRNIERGLRKNRLDQTMRNRMLLWYTLLGAEVAAHDLAEWCLDTYAREATVGCVWFVIWMPEMRPFRQHRRFVTLASRMNLPTYWREYGGPDDEEHAW